MRSKELSVELRQDCVEAEIWGRVHKHYAAFKVPNTVAFIILKWNKFSTTNTLHSAGRLDNLSNGVG